MSVMERKTPLNKWHHENGGKMVNYAGWDMPVQYSKGLKEEHLFTRNKASVFDVSHMGEFRFKGPEALKALNFFSPTNLSELKEGESCYSFFPNENGGVVDDLLIYCFEESRDYLICVNAANTQKIADHLGKYSGDFDVEIVDECDLWGQVAIQGPEAVKITEAYVEGVSNLKRFGFGSFKTKGGFEVCVARTGYTGEDGFEIFVAPENTEKLWTAFLEMGAEPCGLGARDTLRLEAALNLYGNELDESCNPYERRLGWTIDLNKGDFLGKPALEAFKATANRRLIGLKVEDRAIPRAGYDVLKDGEKVGLVTSGTLSPFLGYPIAMAWIDKNALEGENRLEIQIRKKQVVAEVTKLPFLKK